MSHALIVEGVIDGKKLAELKLGRHWLLQELEKHDIDSPKKTFLAELDTSGNLYPSPYEAKVCREKLRH